MARKFQIGDTVEVVEGAWDGLNFRVGHRGKVKDYVSGGSFPYTVVRRNKKEFYFSARELKLIRRKGE
jgi:hypothetical protein